MIHRAYSFGSLSPRINVGIHWWCGSVQWASISRGYDIHSARQPPTAANTPNLHGGFMDVDATLLGF